MVSSAERKGFLCHLSLAKTIAFFQNNSFFKINTYVTWRTERITCCRRWTGLQLSITVMDYVVIWHVTRVCTLLVAPWCFFLDYFQTHYPCLIDTYMLQYNTMTSHERYVVSSNGSFDRLFNSLYGSTSKETSMSALLDFCEEISPVTGNAGKGSIWWRHHDIKLLV